jgi:replicative DNA helicase
MILDELSTTIGEALEASYKYIKDRRDGEAPSLLTPFTLLNDKGVEGIQWQSHVVIGARSGVGKTLIKDQILNAAFNLNPYDNIRVLDFSFEMTTESTGYRSIQAHLKQDKSMLLSTNGNKVDKQTCKRIELVIEKMNKVPWSLIAKPCTLEQIEGVVDDCFKKFDKKGDLKVIISIDHSLLIKKSKNRNSHQTIAAYGDLMTELKKKYNVIIFTLSQLNRNIEEGNRKIPGRAENYPNTSDISTADALLHHADFLMILNRPSDFNLRLYGPDKIIIPENKNYVACHVLKNRSGEQFIIHMRANYENYEFIEMTEEPEKAEDKMKDQTSKFKNSFVQ